MERRVGIRCLEEERGRRSVGGVVRVALSSVERYGRQRARQPGASALNSRLRSRRGTREATQQQRSWRDPLWQGNITFYVPRLRSGRKSESGRKQEKLLIGIETDEEQKVGYNGHEKARKWICDYKNSFHIRVGNKVVGWFQFPSHCSPCPTACKYVRGRTGRYSLSNARRAMNLVHGIGPTPSLLPFPPCHFLNSPSPSRSFRAPPPPVRLSTFPSSDMYSSG